MNHFSLGNLYLSRWNLSLNFILLLFESLCFPVNLLGAQVELLCYFWPILLSHLSYLFILLLQIHFKFLFFIICPFFILASSAIRCLKTTWGIIIANWYWHMIICFLALIRLTTFKKVCHKIKSKSHHDCWSFLHMNIFLRIFKWF